MSDVIDNPPVQRSPAVALSLHGYSPLSAPELYRRLRNRLSPAQLPGDFVLAAENTDASNTSPRNIMLASSALACIPYYYYLSPDRSTFVHGPNVFDCARRARLPWRWNYRSLNLLALLQHSLGAETLHPDILRLPPATVLHFTPGRCEIITGSVDEHARHQPNASAFDPHHSADLLERLVAEAAGNRPLALSLSAGFDSRLLLSVLLKLGLKPIAATMGSDTATDVRIARSLASRSGLEHRVVSLNPSDYFKYAPEIIRLTSGTKSADHWHTFLYIKHAGFPPHSLHLAGAHGESVRSYYFDKGFLARSLCFLPSAAARRFLALKNSPRRRLPLRHARALGPESAAPGEALDLLCSAVPEHVSFLDALDHFYSFERVRHFIGNGLALYHSQVPTFSPFLDFRFLQQAQRMPRAWKLGSRFHRFVIHRNAPWLLDYPSDDSLRPMGKTETPFRCLCPAKTSTYNPFPAVFHSEASREILLESPLLDQFLPRNARLEICRRSLHQLGALLLSLHFVALEAAAVDRAARAQTC